MIKIVMGAICACIAALGCTFAAFKFKIEASQKVEEKQEPKLETAKTRMISVPIISANEIKGYIVTRMEFAVDADLAKANSVPAESFIADEAFKVIYGHVAIDFKLAQTQNLEAITTAVAGNVNKRIGKDVVKHILIDSWTFLKNKDGAKEDEHTEP